MIFGELCFSNTMVIMCRANEGLQGCWIKLRRARREVINGAMPSRGWLEVHVRRLVPTIRSRQKIRRSSRQRHFEAHENVRSSKFFHLVSLNPCIYLVFFVVLKSFPYLFFSDIHRLEWHILTRLKSRSAKMDLRKQLMNRPPEKVVNSSQKSKRSITRSLLKSRLSGAILRIPQKQLKI